jgi:hypothetical protein
MRKKMKNRLFLQSAIHDLLSYPLHSRFFASIRGSKTLNESALRGRIALPVKEARIQRRMGCFDPQSAIMLVRNGYG